jgi:hypothetical protein
VQAVKGILNVGFFAQLGYSITIFTKVIFGITLFGFVFDFPFTLAYVVPTIIIHISTLLAFVAVYKEKPTKKALLYSLVLLSTMYVCIVGFVKSGNSIDTNYNFIFYSSRFPLFPYYTELWVPLAFMCVVLPTQLFQYVVYRVYAKYKNK